MTSALSCKPNAQSQIQQCPLLHAVLSHQVPTAKNLVASSKTSCWMHQEATPLKCAHEPFANDIACCLRYGDIFDEEQLAVAAAMILREWVVLLQ